MACCIHYALACIPPCFAFLCCSVCTCVLLHDFRDIVLYFFFEKLRASKMHFNNSATGSEMDNADGAKEDYKPSYRDIPNTNDVKAAFNDLAYGGLYHLSVVNLDKAET